VPTVTAPLPDDDGVFRRRTAIWLAVICGASLLAALIVGALSHELSEDTSDGGDAFSRSAIGHHALVRWLRTSGVDVVVSRDRSASKSGPAAPLVVAEPTLLTAGRVSREGIPLTVGLVEMLREAESHHAPIVVVLPKWEGTPMPDHYGWIGGAALRPEADVAEVLEAVVRIAVSADEIVRPAKPGTWSSVLGRRLVPTLDTAQLMHPSPELEPLVWCEQGILIARATDRSIYVLSDPDLLNNSGLGRGDNALVADDLFLSELGHPPSLTVMGASPPRHPSDSAHGAPLLRPNDSGTSSPEERSSMTLVLDETLHGFGRPPSLWADLLRFPLLLVTLHLVGLTALVLWATMLRFGKALRVRPRLAPGKQALVESTAELLDAGGHEVESLAHYFRMSVRQAAAACALPPGLVDQDPIAELAALGRARGLTDDLEVLQGEVAAAEGQRATPRHCLAVAAKIHRFCQEIAHGDR